MGKRIKIQNFIHQWWKLAAPFWKSEGRYTAGGLLTLAMGLNIANIYMTVRLNTWSRDFFNAVEAKNSDEFFRQLGVLVILASVSMLLFANQKYFSARAVLLWRKWLSFHYTEKWLHSKAYIEKFSKKIDNPDQRIAEDLRMFPSLTVSMIFDFVDSFGSLGAFAVILWDLSEKYPLYGIVIPGIMFWIALVFVVIGTILIDKIGHPLIGIEWEKQKTEANYRKKLIRLRAHADEIATYGGEAYEEKTLQDKFSHVYSIFLACIKKQRHLDYFNFSYNQASGLVPYILAAPKYFSGAFHMGEMMQTVSAFNGVRVSLSWFIFNYSGLTSWQATMDRLTEFNEWTQAAEQKSKEIKILPSEDVRLENITLKLPNGKPLIKNLNLTVKATERVAIFGASGAGKTTLFRAMRSLWPHIEGNIFMPKTTVLFFSQEPYIPTGTIKEILAYPHASDKYDQEDYTVALEKVDLRDLDPNTQKDYEETLSPGEKQRLALARIWVQKPKWIFWDEALSAVDANRKRSILKQLLRDHPAITVLAIEHERENAFFYSKILTFEDLGETITQRGGNHFYDD